MNQDSWFAMKWKAVKGDSGGMVYRWVRISYSGALTNEVAEIESTNLAKKTPKKDAIAE